MKKTPVGLRALGAGLFLLLCLTFNVHASEMPETFLHVDREAGLVTLFEARDGEYVAVSQTPFREGERQWYTPVLDVRRGVTDTLAHVVMDLGYLVRDVGVSLLIIGERHTIGVQEHEPWSSLGKAAREYGGNGAIEDTATVLTEIAKQIPDQTAGKAIYGQSAYDKAVGWTNTVLLMLPFLKGAGKGMSLGSTLSSADVMATLGRITPSGGAAAIQLSPALAFAGAGEATTALAGATAQSAMITAILPQPDKRDFSMQKKEDGDGPWSEDWESGSEGKKEGGGGDPFKDPEPVFEPSVFQEHVNGQPVTLMEFPKDVAAMAGSPFDELFSLLIREPLLPVWRKLGIGYEASNAKYKVTIPENIGTENMQLLAVRTVKADASSLTSAVEYVKSGVYPIFYGGPEGYIYLRNQLLGSLTIPQELFAYVKSSIQFLDEVIANERFPNALIENAQQIRNQIVADLNQTVSKVSPLIEEARTGIPAADRSLLGKQTLAHEVENVMVSERNSFKGEFTGDLSNLWNRVINDPKVGDAIVDWMGMPGEQVPLRAALDQAAARAAGMKVPELLPSVVSKSWSKNAMEAFGIEPGRAGISIDVPIPGY